MLNELVEGEEDLENEILSRIEEHKYLIGSLCAELSIKTSDLKINKFNSVLEEEDTLRTELVNLEKEKHKRLDEYNKQVIIVNELSVKLCVAPVEERILVPSQKLLNELSERIIELTELTKERKNEMTSLKNEIVQLNLDLDMPTNGEFSDMIMAETIEKIPLGADDLKQARELRDELKHKDNLMINEINTLRVKIRELWSKLGIGNESIHDLVMSDQFTEQKRHIVTVLREEYETCFRIKMENMQKFIDSIRVEIREFLEKMFFGTKEIKVLENNLLALTDYTEDLLMRHEQKKEELEFEFQESQVLFEKTAKWIKLWGDFIQFEEKTKDPARFKVRGN